MKLIQCFLLLGLSLCSRAQLAEKELEKQLYNLPDVQFNKISTPDDRYPKYVLRIRQPLDHLHPEKGYFYQSVVLTHKGFDRPLVMETEGYEGYAGGNEIEKLLNANNLNVEHRYFGTSRPDSLQWSYLTVEQVMADLHHIHELFRELYKDKWITTGISRGGQMAIYYRCFYPKDADLTIPYVAAIPNSLQDTRIYDFLDTIGTKECRQKIFQLQKFLLQHEEEAVNKLKWYAKGRKLSFDHFGSLEKAFEYWVLEYPFSFWQLANIPCEQIPTNRSIDTYLDHLISGVGGIEFLSDKSIQEWVPNGYMSKSQMGFYGYDLAPYRKYLRHVKGENPSAAFLPASVPIPVFDSSFTQKIHRWLEEEGNNILYIYGARDTWSACRVIPSARVNSRSYLIPNANHFQARIRNMDAGMQADITSRIAQLLNREVYLDAIR